MPDVLGIKAELQNLVSFMNIQNNGFWFGFWYQNWPILSTVFYPNERKTKFWFGFWSQFWSILFTVYYSNNKNLNANSPNLDASFYVI